MDELPDGALPVYDIDPDMPAYVVGEEGDSIQTIVKSKRVTVPIFEIASLQKIPFVQVKERRFDVVRRIRTKAKDEVFRKEDARLFSLMEAAGVNNPVNIVMTPASNHFDMEYLTDAFSRIETHGLRVDKIFMNASDYKVFRNAGRDYVDNETSRELLRTGVMGYVWGATVYQSPEIEAGTIHLVTEPEYFGILPVRVDLTVLPADDPANRTLGWSIFEAIGATVHNPKGLQTIKLGPPVP